MHEGLVAGLAEAFVDGGGSGFQLFVGEGGEFVGSGGEVPVCSGFPEVRWWRGGLLQESSVKFSEPFEAELDLRGRNLGESTWKAGGIEVF